MTEIAVHDLIEKCVERDGSAFEQLVLRHQSYAYALAFRFLSDEDDANDIVQEAFIRVWKHIDHFDTRKKFTTWLYSIVTHLALDRLRSLRRKQRVFVSSGEDTQIEEISDGQDSFEVHSNQELAGMVRMLTKELPLKQRLVFTLRDLQDLPVEEVAEIANMSVGSVKTSLHYARRTIRERLVIRYRVGRKDL